MTLSIQIICHDALATAISIRSYILLLAWSEFVYCIVHSILGGSIPGLTRGHVPLNLCHARGWGSRDCGLVFGGVLREGPLQLSQAHLSVGGPHSAPQTSLFFCFFVISIGSYYCVQKHSLRRVENLVMQMNYIYMITRTITQIV